MRFGKKIQHTRKKNAMKILCKILLPKYRKISYFRGLSNKMKLKKIKKAKIIK